MLEKIFKFMGTSKGSEKRSYKFSSQLTLISFVATFFVSFSIAMVMLNLESGHLKEELKKTGTIIAKNLALSSKEFILNNDRWNLYMLCKSIVGENSAALTSNQQNENALEYAVVLNNEGIIVAHSKPFDNRVGYPILDNDILSLNALKSNSLLIQESNSGGFQLFDISHPVHAGERKIGIVRIGISQKGLEELFQTIKKEFLMITFIAALLFGIFSQLIAKWITSPLTKLSNFASTFNPNIPLSNRLPKINSHIMEINTLSKVWIQLSYRIQNSLKELTEKTQKIKEEKAKLERILNGIGAGLIVIDQNLKVVWCNRVFKEWFPMDNYDKNHCYHCINQESICEDCPTVYTFQTGHIHSIEQKGPQNGQNFYKVITVPWRDEGRKIFQVFELWLDITDRATMEKKLKSSEHEALMGRMASGMAHEIRNPLSSLVSSIGTMHKAGSGLSVGDKNSLIDVINKESQRLSTILEDFLRYGRNNKEMKMELCDLGQILDEIVDIAKHRKDIEGRVVFTKKYEKGLSSLINGDREMLQQVFWNLILNSMDAIKKDGTISIIIQRKGNFVDIQIKDTGTGIPPNIKKYMFEPFQTTKKNGTGLGLAIAKKTITMHVGTINLLESSNTGTTFLVRLPISCMETSL